MKFAQNKIEEFITHNKIQIIIRSHECVIDGVEKYGDTDLYTIFSCTNYGGTLKNNAAIFHFHNRTKELSTMTIDSSEEKSHWI